MHFLGSVTLIDGLLKYYPSFYTISECITVFYNIKYCAMVLYNIFHCFVSLVELLEEKGVLTQEEYEKTLKRNVKIA
jgi:hypothetical protein